VAEGIEGLEELAGVPICGAAGDQQAAAVGRESKSQRPCQKAGRDIRNRPQLETH